MTLATSCDLYSGAGLVALKLYILKKCVTCCVIVLSCDISSMSLFQTVYYNLNINHPLIDFLISLIHLGVLGFWGTETAEGGTARAEEGAVQVDVEEVRACTAGRGGEG